MTSVEIYLITIIIILVIWKFEHMKKLEQIRDKLNEISEHLAPNRDIAGCDY